MARPREFEPDDVLDSAMRQFWDRGYRATSVDDLVRATGVANPDAEVLRAIVDSAFASLG
jgi:AcrR family transcriptional regulator